MIDRIDAVAADIDMTLTAKGGSLPKVTVDAFEILHKQGVKIGLATGREIEEKLLQMGKTWGLSFEFDFVVGMNGGMIHDNVQKKDWQTDYMSTEEMREILDWMMPLVNRYSIAVNCEGGGNHNCMNLSKELLESSKRHGFNFVDTTGDIDRFCERPTFKFLFRSGAEYDPEIRAHFLSKYSENYQIVSTFPGTLEIMHKGFDKGTGVKKYAEWNNISMDSIITFGDNENDNPMLLESGWSVCLKDGSAATKACSKDVTDYNCEDGGVGHYLIDHYLKPKGLYPEK